VSPRPPEAPLTSPSPSPAVYALTPRGARLARHLATELSGALYLPRKLATPGETSFDSLPALVAQVFHRHPAHIFLAASGIVVRAIATHLRGKDKDPAVLVLDQNGRHVVSLLSGHLGGANALARRVAALTGGTAVITTATDTAGLPALDLMAQDNGLAIENLAAVRTVSAALLAGQTVQLFDPECRLTVPPAHSAHFEWVASPQDVEPGRPVVAVTWRTGRTAGLDPEWLVLRPRVVVAGVGCRKGAGAEDILEIIRAGCASRGVAVKSLAALASIEAKRNEPGLLEAGRTLGVDMVFYPADQLAKVAVPTPSQRVREHMGVESVCEAAALLAAGTTRLVLAKIKSETVTLALALAT